ncbi:hypothetical protein EVA_06673, partial [gut metagenome]
MSPVIAIRVVETLDEAIDFINEHSSLSYRRHCDELTFVPASRFL